MSHVQHSASKRQQAASAVAIPRAAYSVNQFCEAHSVSRSKLYSMWREGIGPRFMEVGDKRLITVEAAADWRHAREAATAEAHKAESKQSRPSAID
jgi:hypothetical protein